LDQTAIKSTYSRQFNSKLSTTFYRELKKNFPILTLEKGNFATWIWTDELCA